MFLVSILLPFVLQLAAPARQPNLVDAQLRASASHKAYLERTRGAQRCEAQTVSANAAAARAASEATQSRRQLLGVLAEKAAGVAAGSPAPQPDAGELSKAIALLRRDMEASAAMMAKAGAKPQAEPEPGFLAEAAALPQPGTSAGAAGESTPDVNSVIASVLSDLDTEQSLLNAYFMASKLEMERACLDRAEPSADPFRVPARATKRPKGAKQ